MTPQQFAPLAANCRHQEAYAAMWNCGLYETIVVAHDANLAEFRRLRAVTSRWNEGIYSHALQTRFRAMSHKGTVLFVRVE